MEYLDPITTELEEEKLEPSGEAEEVVVAAVEEEVAVEAEVVEVEAESVAVAEGVEA